MTFILVVPQKWSIFNTLRPKVQGEFNALWLIFYNPQKILVKRGGTHFLIFQGEFNAIWSIFKKGNAQKILVDRGGTQIGTFLKSVESLKSRFPKIISIDFDILFLKIYIFAYID